MEFEQSCGQYGERVMTAHESFLSAQPLFYEFELSSIIVRQMRHSHASVQTWVLGYGRALGLPTFPEYQNAGIGAPG